MNVFMVLPFATTVVYHVVSHMRLVLDMWSIAVGGTEIDGDFTVLVLVEGPIGLMRSIIIYHWWFAAASV